MFKLAVIYESGKRYVIPIDKFEGILDEETLKKLRAKALKEIQKL